MEKLTFTISVPPHSESVDWRSLYDEVVEKLLKPLSAIVEEYALGELKWRTAGSCRFIIAYSPYRDSPNSDMGGERQAWIYNFNEVELKRQHDSIARPPVRPKVSLPQFLKDLVAFFERQLRYRAELHGFLTEVAANVAAIPTSVLVSN